MLLLELPFPFALMIALIYLLFNKYMRILVLEEQRNVSYGTVFFQDLAGFLIFSFVVAMSLVDSTAAFTLRCDEIDDTKQMGLLLGRQGINTFSSLAFAIGTPNQQPTDAMFDQFAQRVFTLPSMGQTGKLRRLNFESQTYVLAQLKVTVSSDPSSAAKKLPVPEKQARIADLKHRLNGVALEGEKEPAYSLIDLCQTIYDTGNIVWIHPSKCHKRDSEVKASVRDPKPIVKVESQVLRIENETSSDEADHGTELKLMWCLQRRGFALDMTGVVSWDVHEKWVDALFRSYASDVSQATRTVTLSQLIKADCELWTLLARENHTVKPNAHGDKPLDLATYQTAAWPSNHCSPHTPTGWQTWCTTTRRQSDRRPEDQKRPGKRGRTPPNVPTELKECYQPMASLFVGPTTWQPGARPKQEGIHLRAIVEHMCVRFAARLVTVMSSAEMRTGPKIRLRPNPDSMEKRN